MALQSTLLRMLHDQHSPAPPPKPPSGAVALHQVFNAYVSGILDVEPVDLSALTEQTCWRH